MKSDKKKIESLEKKLEFILETNFVEYANGGAEVGVVASPNLKSSSSVASPYASPIF